MRQLCAIAAALVAALALGGCGRGNLATNEQAAASHAVSRLDLGHGAQAVVVLRPAGLGGKLPGLVFLHGWNAVDPQVYGPWLTHLVATGNEVIYPRYQVTSHTLPNGVLANAEAGIRAALQREPIAAGTLVVAGHSAGGSLSADLTASAGDAGLPPPLALVAFYPGRRLEGVPQDLPEVDPGRILAATTVVALAGAADTVAGSSAARRIVEGATRVPPIRRVFRIIRTPGIDGHDGPLMTSRAARATLWGALDGTIAAARQRGAVAP